MSDIKILIVEDDTFIAEDIASNLRSAGYQVTGIADQGEEALRLAAANPPDLVLMDIMIQGVDDGIEVATKLKNQGNYPVIFISSLYDKENLQRAQALKPANYLTKPFTEHQLLVSIHQALFNISEEEEASLSAPEQSIPEAMRHSDDFFIRDKNGNYKKCHISDILFIEAARAYCTIHTRAGKFVQSKNMASVREKFDHPALVQASRFFVVNIKNITEVKGNMLVVDGTEILTGDQFRENIFKMLRLVR